MRKLEPKFKSKLEDNHNCADNYSFDTPVTEIDGSFFLLDVKCVKSAIIEKLKGKKKKKEADTTNSHVQRGLKLG